MPLITNANVISDSAQILDGIVATGDIADNAVTDAKLADATQGDILIYGAAGAPAKLAAGTSGFFLKTQGAGANPAWATVATDWEQLGQQVLGGAANSMTVASFAARKYLRIVIDVVSASAGCEYILTFNSDSGLNYTYRVVSDGAAAADSVGNEGLLINQPDASTTLPVIAVVDVFNFAAGRRKTAIYQSTVLSASGTTAIVSVNHGALIWNNTADQITTAKVALSGGANLGTGSSITVYASKD